jgi:hypothetical protein
MVGQYSMPVDSRIAGNAEISLLVGGKPYQTEKLSGAVTFRWDGDYYADEAEVRYKPTTVTGGSLRLTYQFHDI